MQDLDLKSLRLLVAVCEADAAASELTDLLRAGLHQRPGFTLRGGTNEILRGVIARGMGMR